MSCFTIAKGHASELDFAFFRSMAKLFGHAPAGICRTATDHDMLAVVVRHAFCKLPGWGEFAIIDSEIDSAGRGSSKPVVLHSS